MKSPGIRGFCRLTLFPPPLVNLHHLHKRISMASRSIPSFFLLLLLCSLCFPAAAQVAGSDGANELVIAQDGKTQATILVSEKAGRWEKQAAVDLQKYIELM